MNIKFLGWFGKYDVSNKKRIDIHIDIITYLEEANPLFNKLTPKSIGGNLDELYVYFEEWISFLTLNYYKHLYKPSTLMDIDEEECQFFGKKPNTLSLEDDYLITGYNQNLVMHMWCVMMNFFRIFRKYDNVNPKTPPNINDIISNILEKWPLQLTDESRAEIWTLLIDKYEELSVVFDNEDDGVKTTIEEETINVEPSYDDVMSHVDVLPLKHKKMPSIHQIFSSLHFFVNVILTIEKKASCATYVDTELKEGDITIYELLRSWVHVNSDIKTSTDLESIERMLFILGSFQGNREIFCYSNVFDKEEDEHYMRCYSLAFIPRRQKESMVKFQKKTALFIDKFNSLEHDLFYFFTDQLTCVSESYKLLMFHYIIKDEMKYSQWFFRFTVQLNMYHKYMTEVHKYSEKTPLFIKIEPFKYNLLYKKKIYSGSIETLLFYWLNVNKNGIFPLANLSECPWISDWAVLQPKDVKLTEAIHTTTISKNMITPSFRAKFEDKEGIIEEIKPIVDLGPKLTSIDLLYS